LQHRTISIIDDDASVRGAVSRLLRLYGFVTYAFASAEDFLQSDHLSETSCLIADVRMPGMTGIELLEFLVRQGPHIPVVFITAFPEETSRMRALSSGAVCFLKKPFDAQTLIGCIEEGLKGPDAAPEADKSN
jgi:FixJ family two-component response regulator